MNIGLIAAAAAAFIFAPIASGPAHGAPIVVPSIGLQSMAVNVFDHRRKRHDERYAYYYGYPDYGYQGYYPYQPFYYRPYYYQRHTEPYYGHSPRPWHRRHRHHRHHRHHWK